MVCARLNPGSGTVEEDLSESTDGRELQNRSIALLDDQGPRALGSADRTSASLASKLPVVSALGPFQWSREVGEPTHFLSRSAFS